MKNNLLFITIAACISLTTGCTYMSQGFPDNDRAAEAIAEDHYGDSAQSIIYLDQKWDASDSLWFYNTSQGSDLIPYDIFLHLKQAGNGELFRSSKNMRKFRYLTQNASYGNPDGLPVGFVKDDYEGRAYLGFTCAACHTTQINYNGNGKSIGIRIDGGPAMADMDSMLRSLESALDDTLHRKNKFNALAQTIFGSQTSSEKGVFKQQLQQAKDKISYYNLINISENDGQSVNYGFARLDAFGRIYNRILAHIKPKGATFNSPNAPVSYPFLWDTPQYNYVQWNGVGNNNAGGITGYFGPLGRNVGEVLGVFATFEVTSEAQGITALSADKHNIVRLEEHLGKLKSPQWPEKSLEKINTTLAKDGKKVFVKFQCYLCHRAIDSFTKEQRKHGLVAEFSSVDIIGTDEQMALNAVGADGDTGLLAGKTNPLTGDNFSVNEAVVASLTKVTADAIVAGDQSKPFFIRWAEQLDVFARSFFNNPVSKPTHRFVDFQEQPTELYAYKGRALNGIWATAPYLHNGSVPNLYELFLPACSNAEIAAGKKCRSNTFNLGSREFDTKKVGFVNKDKAIYKGLFTYDTSIPGNHNHGHEYAVGKTPIPTIDANGRVNYVTFKQPINDKERWALVEYLKTL